MSVVKKYQTGSVFTPKKIKFNVNNRDIDVDEEDIDKVYESAINALPTEQQEEARNYVAKELKPSILVGDNKLDTMGAGMLNMNIQGSGQLASSNRPYSQAELKKMFKSKDEREQFLNKQKMASTFNKAFESNLANYFSQKQLGEEQATAAKTKSEAEQRMAQLGSTEDFFKYSYGEKQVTNPLGYSQAQYNFSKLSPDEQKAKINAWTLARGKGLAGLNLENPEDIAYAQKTLGANYKPTITELKTKFVPGTEININDYPALAAMTQTNLQRDILFDPNVVNKWKDMSVTGEPTTPIQEEPMQKDSQGTLYKGEKPFEGEYEGTIFKAGLPINETVNNILYQQGKPYTGYMAPKFGEESETQNIVQIYNPKNYGGYIGGKRLSDTEFYQHVSKLPEEEREKQFPGYMSALQTQYNVLPKEYIDLSKITDTNKTFLGSIKGLGTHAVDLTKYYDKSVEGGRLIQVVDTNKSKQAATPWSSAVKNYRVYQDENGKIQKEPFTIRKNQLTGEDQAIFIRGGKEHAFGLGKSDTSGSKYTQHDFSIPFAGKPILRKHGGELPKLQLGGSFMESLSYGPTKGEAEKKLSKSGQKKLNLGEIIDTGVGIKSTEGFKLTASDYADLAALGLDAAGMLASFGGPVGNIAAGVAGLGSTAATAYGDIKRDGADWGDLANFGANVGLDVLSALPLVGAGGKYAKFAKGFKNAEKLMKFITPALISIGATSSAAAIQKGLKDPMNMTVDDLTSIVSGIRLLTGGVKGTTRRIGKTSDTGLTFKAKVGDTTHNIALNPKQSKQFSELPTSKEKHDFLTSVSKSKVGENVEAKDIDIVGVDKIKGLDVGLKSPLKWGMKREFEPALKKESSFRFKTKEELEGTNPLTQFFGNRNRERFEKYTTKTNITKPIVEANNPVPPAIPKVNPPITPITKEKSPIIPLIPKTETIQPVVKPNTGTTLELSPDKLSSFQKAKETTKRIGERRLELVKSLGLNKNKEQIKNTITSYRNNRYAYINPKASPISKLVTKGRAKIEDKKSAQEWIKNAVKNDKKNDLKKYVRPENSPISKMVSKGREKIALKEKAELEKKSTPKKKIPKAQNGLLLKPINSKPLVQKPLIPSSFQGSKPNLSHLQGNYDERMVKFDKPTFEKPVLFNQQSVQLNKQSYPDISKKDTKTGLLSKVDPIMLGDIARTIAGNISNSQINQKISTPLLQQTAETYISPASTATRDAYYKSASRFINTKPQTSDALANEMIRRSNAGKAEELRTQGDLSLAEQNANIATQNQQLAGQYAQQRAGIANQNIANLAQAENQGIQMTNQVRGMNAENIQNLAYRWLMNADKTRQENKGINTQIALNRISSEINPQQSLLLSELNSMQDKIRLENRVYTPQEKQRIKDLNELNSKYSNIMQNASLESQKNPNYSFDLAKEKTKYSIFKKGGELSAIDRYNILNDNRLNRSMDKKYELSLKNRLEMLKAILKK